MKNTVHTQSERSVFERQSYSSNGQQPRSGVGQDNPAHPPAPSATLEPAPLQKYKSAERLNSKTSRSQNKRNYRKSTVKVTSWVKPVIKQEIEQLAKSEGLSISAMSASLLEKALQQSLYIRYAALIDPIIEKAIGKHMRSYSTRIAVLLVRSLFTSEQTRSLTTNVLGRQQGITPKELNEILDGSSRAAKRNITHITPQLTALIEEVEKWLGEGEKPHG